MFSSVLAESNRVPLQYMAGVENSDYINAVFVHVCTSRFMECKNLAKVRPHDLKLFNNYELFLAPLFFIIGLSW